MKIRRQKSFNNLIYFSPDETRVKKFRKRYKVGDRLRAKVLKLIDKKRAVIQIDEVKLIALLKDNIGASDFVLLEVKQLYPHIILKHAKDSDQGISLYI
ncbi:hypothetical protein JCM13304A_17790 [Desulfothermus okinawensis JCM 13304]